MQSMSDANLIFPFDNKIRLFLPCALYNKAGREPNSRDGDGAACSLDLQNSFGTATAAATREKSANLPTTAKSISLLKLRYH